MIVRLPVTGTPVPLDFDPDRFRARFAEERQVRLRPERVRQDREAVTPDRPTACAERPPVEEDVDVAVLGGGMGGLLAGSYLRDEGVHDFRIVENGDDFGGTWYWNRYPGVQCDVESHLYLPRLDDTGYVPRQRYADGAEILDYLRDFATRWNLYDRALLKTSVTDVAWHEDTGRWQVRTDAGDLLRARFVLRASGPLSKPLLPALPGIDRFRGAIFHTSRWDYDYTGGSPAGELTGLRDKTVAVVGTGASGVQVIPFLAEDAGKLLVVQRTPAAVGVRANRPTDPDWAAGLEPGWQTSRVDNFTRITNLHPQDHDHVADTWTSLFTRLDGHHLVDVPLDSLPVEDRAALAELADLSLMRELHRRIDEVVDDPDTAERLKPWHGMLCKRPTTNDDYLPAFNRDSVTLLSHPGGIEAVTETGIVVGGQEHAVDCLVFATGFDTGAASADRYGYEVTGRDGLTMRTAFRDGSQTLYGFFTAGFPNYLELGKSQNAFRVNFSYMLDRKARHAARTVRAALADGIRAMEPEPEAQRWWGAVVEEAALRDREYLAACTPGYYTGQGDLSRGFFNDIYRGSEIDFWDMIDQWWETGNMPGLARQYDEEEPAR